MPYIKNISSIVGKGDSCGGGMKKTGLVSSSEYPRVNSTILKTRGPSKLPPFSMMCNCGVRSRVYGTRIVHGRAVPMN
jgi:hypothetical protein